MLIKWTPTAEVNMVKNSRGCYQIRTAADLYRLNSIKTVDPSVGGEVIDPEEETFQSWFLLQQASNRQVRSEK
ncbi:hypothetical protein B7993_01525 [Fibrobacter sp. UWH3]|nr:hypothetical protein B7993_01525 [Fibrobacter sp. UWH3]